MFRIPGTKLKLRTFDRVETANDTYDIFDVGVEYEDGNIDSIAVGGSFYSLKSAISKLNDNVDSAPAATPLVAVSGEAAWYLLPYPNRVGAFFITPDVRYQTMNWSIVITPVLHM